MERRASDVLLLTAIDPLSYQIIPDLGLMCLAGALRQIGAPVRIVDCRKERWGIEELERHVRDANPTIVGIKCYSHEARRVGRMAAAIRRVLPEAVILAGGPHPSLDPEGTLAEMPEVDYAFVGEAERSLAAFYRWAEAGRGGPLPEDIRGVAWRTDSRVEVRAASFEADLDRLPLPAWDLMRPDRYPDEAAGVFVPAFPAAPVMLSRGCPFQCAYCGCRSIVGQKMRYRSVANVLEEIDLLERDYGVRTFTFVDDNFTCNRGRAMALFEALAARPRSVHFTFPNGVRADSLDAEMLKTMERAGCYLIALGIESGSDETLARMRKRQTTAQAREAVELIRRSSTMRVTGFFILGYPGESLSDVRETIRFAATLPIHNAHFCLFIPIPGTKVYEDLKEMGWRPDPEADPELLTIDRPSLDLPGLPRRKMLRLHQYAYFRFYAAPWRILDLVKQLKSPGHLRLIARRFLKLFL